MASKLIVLLLCALLPHVAPELRAQISCGSCPTNESETAIQFTTCTSIDFSFTTRTAGGCTKENAEAECKQTKNCVFSCTVTITRSDSPACSTRTYQYKKCSGEVDPDGNVTYDAGCGAWIPFTPATAPKPENEPVSCGDYKEWRYEEVNGQTTTVILAIWMKCEPDCPTSEG